MDLRPEPGEQERGRAADPRPRAGDHGDLSRELGHRAGTIPAPEPWSGSIEIVEQRRWIALNLCLVKAWLAVGAVLAVAIGAVAALLADPHLWERNHVAHAHPPRAIVFAPPRREPRWARPPFALREARNKAREELASAQKELKDVLNARQEAVLVMMGMLD